MYGTINGAATCPPADRSRASKWRSLDASCAFQRTCEAVGSTSVPAINAVTPPPQNDICVSSSPPPSKVMRTVASAPSAKAMSTTAARSTSCGAAGPKRHRTARTARPKATHTASRAWMPTDRSAPHPPSRPRPSAAGEVCGVTVKRQVDGYGGRPEEPVGDRLPDGADGSPNPPLQNRHTARQKRETRQLFGRDGNRLLDEYCAPLASATLGLLDVPPRAAADADAVDVGPRERVHARDRASAAQFREVRGCEASFQGPTRWRWSRRADLVQCATSSSALPARSTSPRTTKDRAKTSSRSEGRRAGLVVARRLAPVTPVQSG